MGLYSRSAAAIGICETVSPELIIFDCDGVLIDSEAIACRTDSACLAEIGIAMSAEEIMERYLGISADDDVRRHRAAPGTRAAGGFCRDAA